MTKSKKLRIGFVGGLLLLAAGSLRPVFAENYRVMDSTTVSVSSSMVTGATKVLSATNNPAFVVLYVPATAGVTGEQVAIGSDTSVSTNTTSGYFRIPVNTLFTLHEWQGPLYAIAVGTSPLNVSVLRKR